MPWLYQVAVSKKAKKRIDSENFDIDFFFWPNSLESRSVRSIEVIMVSESMPKMIVFF